MRLSELLHTDVIDRDGVKLGTVEDVRLVQDGPLLLPFGAAFRVAGFVVGRGSLGIRLGYQRGQVDGPWLLSKLFGWLQRRALYVPWELVESVGDDAVRITATTEDLEPPQPTS
jgi:sporulation protein YlmC with PRC-barrel domain